MTAPNSSILSRTHSPGTQAYLRHRQGVDMDVRFLFILVKTPLSVDAGYEEVLKLPAALRPWLPGVSWHFVLSASAADRTTWINVYDRPRVLAHYRERCAHLLRTRPGYLYGFSAILVRDPADSGFRVKQGRCTLTFAPGHGDMQLDILRPGLAWPQRDLTTMMKGILEAVVRQSSVSFASLDIKQAQRPYWRPSADLYRTHGHTVSDRACLGWMGFVPSVLARADVPQAADLIPVPEKGGSLVVAVRDTFDVNNPQHIAQAQ